MTPSPAPPFDSAYLALLQKGQGSSNGFAYVDSQTPSAFQSHLIERLYAREFGAGRSLNGGSCVGDPPLNDDERRTFVRWVDLGAPYRGVTP